MKPNDIKTEIYWRLALSKSNECINNNHIQPLDTHILNNLIKENNQFEIRMLDSKKPNHLSIYRPKPNPFASPEEQLKLANINNTHLLILNKYPVQIGHMLLITNKWLPQDGWLDLADWKSFEIVDRDTTGLWFFNSSFKAGASQPHRHIQLLRRSINERICPRERWIELQIGEKRTTKWARNNYLSVVPRDSNSSDCSGEYMYQLYLDLCKTMNLGSPKSNLKPTCPYNLLISRDWMVLIRRSSEETNGININALGFAGYLLLTRKEDLEYLEMNGAERILLSVVDAID